MADVGDEPSQQTPNDLAFSSNAAAAAAMARQDAAAALAPPSAHTPIACVLQPPARSSIHSVPIPMRASGSTASGGSSRSASTSGPPTAVASGSTSAPASQKSASFSTPSLTPTPPSSRPPSAAAPTTPRPPPTWSDSAEVLLSSIPSEKKAPAKDAPTPAAAPSTTSPHSRSPHLPHDSHPMSSVAAAVSTAVDALPSSNPDGAPSTAAAPPMKFEEEGDVDDESDEDEEMLVHAADAPPPPAAPPAAPALADAAVDSTFSGERGCFCADREQRDSDVMCSYNQPNCYATHVSCVERICGPAFSAFEFGESAFLCRACVNKPTFTGAELAAKYDCILRSPYGHVYNPKSDLGRTAHQLPKRPGSPSSPRSLSPVLWLYFHPVAPPFVRRSVVFTHAGKQVAWKGDVKVKESKRVGRGARVREDKKNRKRKQHEKEKEEEERKEKGTAPPAKKRSKQADLPPAPTGPAAPCAHCAHCSGHAAPAAVASALPAAPRPDKKRRPPSSPAHPPRAYPPAARSFSPPTLAPATDVAPPPIQHAGQSFWCRCQCEACAGEEVPARTDAAGTPTTVPDFLRALCDPSSSGPSGASSGGLLPPEQRLPSSLLPLLQQLLEPTCISVAELRRMPAGLSKQLLLTALHRLPKDQHSSLLQEADALAQLWGRLIRTA